ncbi:GIY-YIG nuclease family protein [Pelagibius sp. CAU 1746]|uniref:GIY-YIG nuclease family protein n=1 Tax=Pelagibius sp. CAU 1746 TaxID=3140370 RepID=UPI00325B1DA7
MLPLTKDQIDFLRRHKIPLTQVFDATGMRPKDYKKAMHEEEKLIAVGVTPCRDHNHSMRTPSGNCVQCNPATIEYKRRHAKPGFVYISASRSSELIKVGSSRFPDEREALLNQRGYGGISDWSKICEVQCRNAGRIEFEVHELLAAYATPRSYLRDGVNVDCTEIFSCGYPCAREALLGVLSEEEAESFRERKDAAINYNFTDRASGKSARGGAT